MKHIISILLATVMATLSVSGHTANTQQVQVEVTVGFFGQIVEMPDGLPQDVQDQIQVIIASMPSSVIGWGTVTVIVVFVVVVGIMLYCIWRCAKKLDQPPPPPPQPDDGSVGFMPHLTVYNTKTSEECELQFCTDLNNPIWQRVCTFDGTSVLDMQPLPEADRIFFRLEAK